MYVQAKHKHTWVWVAALRKECAVCGKYASGIAPSGAVDRIARAVNPKDITVAISAADAREKYDVTSSQLTCWAKKDLVYRISYGWYDEASLVALLESVERSESESGTSMRLKPKSRITGSRSSSPIKNHHFIY